jgi:hypothetical protein
VHESGGRRITNGSTLSLSQRIENQSAIPESKITRRIPSESSVFVVKLVCFRALDVLSNHGVLRLLAVSQSV